MALMSRLRRFMLLALLLAGVFVAGVLLAQWARLPALTEEEVRETVLTTLERETPEAFLVTGRLDLSAAVTMVSEKSLLPGLLDLDLGTTRATVRAPGQATYGFDVRQLRPEHIQLEGDSVVVVTIPPLEVLSVEPDLSRLDVQTQVGWARLQASSGERMEREALARLVPALRRQADAYLDSAALQPRANTAEALETLLRPAFAALGHDALTFRFQLTPEIVREGDTR